MKHIVCPICDAKLLIDEDNFGQIDEDKMGDKIQKHVRSHKFSQIIDYLEQVLVDLSQEAFYEEEDSEG